MEGPAVSTWTRNGDAGLSSRLATPSARATERGRRLPGSRRSHWREPALLLALMLFTAVIRIWILCHTEVAARDSIGFIRMALQFEKLPFAEVVRNSAQHPGYPLTLLAVSWPIRWIMGTTPESMQLSAQATSALASVLLVIPMFWLGRELFDRRAGFWGSVLFQCLPVSSRILADGLSEATFLLFTTTALLLAVRALRERSVWRFALCGAFSGLAYFTRPEGALVALAAGLVLLGIQLSPLWRYSWRQVLACGGSLAVGAVLVGAPYVLITGHLTNKPTGGQILNAFAFLPDEHPTRISVSSGSISQPLMASLFGIYAPEWLQDRTWWGLYAIGTEVVKSYEYIAILPVLIGLWWFRDRLRGIPGSWVVVAFCALHGLVLWRMACVVGYVSDRHVQLLVLCGVFTWAAAVGALGNWLGRNLARLRRQSPELSARAGNGVALVLLAVCALIGLPDGLRTLHANRAGHRAAGLWLAAHTQPADEINDPFCWAHYYAGRVFLEGTVPEVPAGYQPVTYVVLDRPDLEHKNLTTLKKAIQLSENGALVYHWPENQPVGNAKIRVFTVAHH
jgi:4-amino-4-deoxy-L-arabinose transferase-like glycosyltransferase